MSHTIAPKSHVLVTGASGYIAAWVARTYLERGHSVIGTVRSSEKGKELEVILGDRFTWTIVKDISEEGAFDDAVKGVDAIAHVASPFHFKADDPQDLIRPAVNGTVGILESARKFGKSVRRIVITSSTAAVAEMYSEPVALDESTWNEMSIREVNEKGKNTVQHMKYRASKTLAEKAAWEWYNKHKSDITFDIVALNPAMVYGPVTHSIKSPDALGTSTGDWYNVVTTAGGKTNDELKPVGVSWVDVRDLAEAHARALEREEAGGERIITVSGPVSWQQWLDAANAVNTTSKTIPKGVPGQSKDVKATITYLTGKGERLLGLTHNAEGRDPKGLWKYRTLEETSIDTLKDYESRGW